MKEVSVTPVKVATWQCQSPDFCNLPRTGNDLEKSFLRSWKGLAAKAATHTPHLGKVPPMKPNQPDQLSYICHRRLKTYSVTSNTILRARHVHFITIHH